MVLSCNLEFLCTVCGWKSNIFTSKKIVNSKTYDINQRSIIAFRENGKGYTGLESLCYLLKRCTTNEQECLSKTIIVY